MKASRSSNSGELGSKSSAMSALEHEVNIVGKWFFEGTVCPYQPAHIDAKLSVDSERQAISSLYQDDCTHLHYVAIFNRLNAIDTVRYP